MHRENLKATRIAATASTDGKITDVLEVPDYPTRQRAVADAYRVRGRMKDDASLQAPPQPRIVVLSRADAELFRVFTGGQDLPDCFQFAPEDIADGLPGDEGQTVDVSAEKVLPHDVG